MTGRSPDEVALFKPHYDQREAEAVSRVLKSGWSGLGPEVEAFETEFAKHVRMRHAVATNSCTSALMLALSLLDTKPGDEVIVPSLTFASTAHAVALLGLKPVFCDVDRDTLMIDWHDADQCVTSRTKAVIVVNYAGQPRGGPLVFHDIPVIWDFAHAGGARPVYPFGATGCWSFHSVKNISCGDGGMVTTNDDKAADKLRILRWMGIDKSTWARIDLVKFKRYDWEYQIKEIGHKAHMNDITAAIGRVQLSKINKMQEHRLDVASQYHNWLCNEINQPQFHGDHHYPQEHGWHLYPIRVLPDDRNPLMEHLKKAGIQCGVHYQPVHQFHCYQVRRTLPVVEEEWKTLISLPMHACLTQKDIDRVIKAVNGFYK